MKKAGFILLMILGSFACKKDDIGNGGGGPANNKIKRVEKGNGEVTTFVYNPAGKLTQIKLAEGSTTEVMDLQYDGAGVLRRINQSEGYQYDFSYQNGELTKIDAYYANEKFAMRTFVYYEVTREVQSIHSFLADDNNNAVMRPFLRQDFVYDIDGKNVRSTNFYYFSDQTNTFRPLSSFEYPQYDDKQNPFEELGMLSYFLFNTKAVNNPLKVVEKDELGDVIEIIDYNYVYSGRLPIRAKEITNQTQERQVLFQY